MTTTTALARANETTAAMVEKVACMLAEVKLSLPEASDAGALLELRAQAGAMKVFLRQRDAALASQLDAAEIKLRTERRLGELIREIPAIPNDGSRGNAAGPASGPATVSTPKSVAIADMGIAKQRASEWAKLAEVPAEAFEKHATSIRTKAEQSTRNKPDLLASDEWYTPAKYIESARAVLGGFDLDPASNPIANETVKAKRIYTIADSGLVKQWKGSVWLNPPYVDGEVSTIGSWIAHMIAEHAAGRLTKGILLVNAKTSAGWFRPLWDFPICFTDHRIKFYTPEGMPRAPVTGNAFVYFGEDVRAFAAEFKQHGTTVRRVK